MPAFDLQGGVLLSAVRAASVCALLSVFGALVFRLTVAPRAFARMSEAEMGACKRVLLALAQASAVAGLGANFAWLCVQAADMADTQTLSAALGAVPEVAKSTTFGHFLLAQSLCLAGTIGVLGVRDRQWRQRGALGLAAAALCLQAGHSHAYSMYDGPSILLACDVLHLLGAGAWLGGLLPLLIVVRCGSPRAGAAAARWFSPLGQVCIAALVVSAAWQGWVLIASVPGLVGTAYGWMALGKLALFGVLLGFAVANRYWLGPALARDARKPSFFEKKDQETPGVLTRGQSVLLRSLVLQSCAAVAILGVAAVLSELPPAMHDQPVWPFAQRFSLDAVTEDPDFRREVMIAGAALIGAGLVLAAALVRRRWRVFAGVFALVTAWFAVPHLDLLLVPAYPTSFYRSPTGFTAASIVQGRTIYARHCVSCHGLDGRGDHPIQAGLAAPPADLTAAHLWMHSDGDLFWWLSHGIATPEGAQAMPGFAGVLADDDIWAVIDFIRAHNAGTARSATGDWPHMLQAPDFGVECGPDDRRVADMRGLFLRLRFTMPAASSAGGAAVSAIAENGRPGEPPAHCSTAEATVPLAYEIISGLDAAQMKGSEFLIDENGWLRAMQPAGAAPAWLDPAALAAEIRMLRARKPGGDAPMKMPM